MEECLPESTHSGEAKLDAFGARDRQALGAGGGTWKASVCEGSDGAFVRSAPYWPRGQYVRLMLDVQSEFAAASANQAANAMSEADVTSSLTCNVDSEAMPPSVTRRGP